MKPEMRTSDFKVTNREASVLLTWIELSAPRSLGPFLKLAKESLVKSHLVKSQLVESGLVESQLVKSHLVESQSANPFTSSNPTAMYHRLALRQKIRLGPLEAQLIESAQ